MLQMYVHNLLRYLGSRSGSRGGASSKFLKGTSLACAKKYCVLQLTKKAFKVLLGLLPSVGRPQLQDFEGDVPRSRNFGGTASPPFPALAPPLRGSLGYSIPSVFISYDHQHVVFFPFC